MLRSVKIRKARQTLSGRCAISVFLYLVLILVLVGCGPGPKVPVRVCPGLGASQQSLSRLKLHSESAVSFRGHGHCRLSYHDAKGKQHKENFAVKLWANPPAEVYMQGDVAFNPKGIVLGSNKNEFWLAIRPKEVSSYWWGRWAEQKELLTLPVSPRILLEAMGVAEIDPEAHWSLSNQGPYDVLSSSDPKGRLLRKIYIYCCDYLVRKIEYFDKDGKLVVLAELGSYKQVGKEFSVPGYINVSRVFDDGKKDSVRIKLSSVKQTQFSQKQRQVIFSRPAHRGFAHEFVIIEGERVEILRQ